MILFESEWVTAYYNVCAWLVMVLIIYIVLWFIIEWRKTNTERMRLTVKESKQ